MTQSLGNPVDVKPSMSEALLGLVARGEVRRYRKGTVLIEEGEAGDTLFIVLSGRLRAFASAANGREITFGIYGPGEYLGELSLDGGIRSASVETVEASACAVVTRETLRNHILQCPEFALELLTKVIRRTRAATLSARNLALNDVYGRLKQLLEALGQVQPNGERHIDERLTHRALAQRLGCSREMISRVMKDLADGGYVCQQEGRLVLKATLPPRW